MGGRLYYVTFTDDHSCYTKIAVIQYKSGTFDAYKEFAEWARTQHRVKIKRLHSDCGDKYTGDAFTKYFKQQGTKRCLPTYDTPQHNGIAELLNRCIILGLPSPEWTVQVFVG